MSDNEKPTNEYPIVPPYRFTPHWARVKAMAALTEDTMAEVELRLIQGDKEYGDASWQLPTAQLIDEVIQEQYDVIGWLVLTTPRLNETQLRTAIEVMDVAEESIKRLKAVRACL